MELQIFLVVAVGILIATRLPSAPQLDQGWLEDMAPQPVPVARQRWCSRR